MLFIHIFIKEVFCEKILLIGGVVGSIAVVGATIGAGVWKINSASSSSPIEKPCQTNQQKIDSLKKDFESELKTANDNIKTSSNFVDLYSKLLSDHLNKINKKNDVIYSLIKIIVKNTNNISTNESMKIEYQFILGDLSDTLSFTFNNPNPTIEPKPEEPKPSLTDKQKVEILKTQIINNLNGESNSSSYNFETIFKKYQSLINKTITDSSYNVKYKLIEFKPKSPQAKNLRINSNLVLKYEFTLNQYSDTYEFTFNNPNPEKDVIDVNKLISKEGFEIENGVVNKYTKSSVENLIIPEYAETNPDPSTGTISRIKITGIGKCVFESKGIKKITFPSSLEIIDDYAFFKNEITTANLNNSNLEKTKLTKIGFFAFGYNDLRFNQQSNTSGSIKFPERLIKYLQLLKSLIQVHLKFMKEFIMNHMWFDQKCIHQCFHMKMIVETIQKN